MILPFLDIILRDYFRTNSDIKILKISEGLTNFNYKVELSGGNRYFLKVFRRADVKRVESIANLMDLLHRYNFPTPEIIPCLDGTKYWSDGEKSAILTNFIDGRYPQKNKMELYQIGNILGALHLVPPDVPLIKGYSLKLQSQWDAIKSSGKRLEDDLLLLIEKTDPFIRNLKDRSFPESIIHGDVFLDNLIINEFGDMYFVDFEGGCVDDSIFDLSRAVIGCAIVHNRIDLDLTFALVSGYNIVRNLGESEREYLYEFIIYAGTVSSLWRYNEFYIKRHEENKMYLYRQLMNPVMEFIKIPKIEFQDKLKSSYM